MSEPSYWLYIAVCVIILGQIVDKLIQVSHDRWRAKHTHELERLRGIEADWMNAIPFLHSHGWFPTETTPELPSKTYASETQDSKTASEIGID